MFIRRSLFYIIWVFYNQFSQQQFVFWMQMKKEMLPIELIYRVVDAAAALSCQYVVHALPVVRLRDGVLSWSKRQKWIWVCWLTSIHYNLRHKITQHKMQQSIHWFQIHFMSYVRGQRQNSKHTLSYSSTSSAFNSILVGGRRSAMVAYCLCDLWCWEWSVA